MTQQTLHLSFGGIKEFIDRMDFVDTVGPIARDWVVDLGVIYFDHVTETVNPKGPGFVPIVTGNLRNSARLGKDPSPVPQWSEVAFTADYAKEINDQARRRWLPGPGYHFIEGAFERANREIEEADKDFLEAVQKAYAT